MTTNEREGTKYPQTGAMGVNTPFAIQSRKKERDNGHNTLTQIFMLMFQHMFRLEPGLLVNED